MISGIEKKKHGTPVTLLFTATATTNIWNKSS